MKLPGNRFYITSFMTLVAFFVTSLSMGIFERLPNSLFILPTWHYLLGFLAGDLHPPTRHPVRVAFLCAPALYLGGFVLSFLLLERLMGFLASVANPQVRSAALPEFACAYGLMLAASFVGMLSGIGFAALFRRMRERLDSRSTKNNM